MTKPTQRFTVRWETFAIAGNPRINPGKDDENVVLCCGWTVVWATSMEQARGIYATDFPRDRIVAIK